MTDKKQEETNVQTVEVDDLNEILGMPGAETIMTPEEGGEEKKEKPGIFSDLKPDVSFLDPTGKTKTEKPAEKEITPGTKEKVAAGKELENLEEDDKAGKGGRPTGLLSVTKKLIEKGILMPFEEEKKIEDYTQEDFEELYETNLQEMQESMASSLPEQFFKNMPEEMQKAYTYIANGGTDIKGFFRALSDTNEVKDLDINNSAGQKQAIRTYLHATRWGTSEEIEEEINSLEDKGELSKKAKQFKPKLDAMQEQIVNQKLLKQAQAKKQREAQSQQYMESVYSTLEKGELSGIKLDNRIQNMLYSGLVQPNYPSVTGKQTNLLGHLLEKYQWVEPRHDLIAEALWLLADPDGYHQSIAGNAEKSANAKTLRTLKTEQSNRSTAGNGVEEEEENAGKTTRRTVQRPKRNFFGRE